jgi:hypothetical protein
MIKKKIIAITLTLTFCLPVNTYAWLSDGGAGWANYPYIIKILLENIKRYQQLKFMIGQAKNSHQFVKLINEGINNAVGLMEVLPIKDEKILAQFKNYSTALKKINDLYGAIPKSADGKIQLLHDRTIAESFKLANAVSVYAEKQEKNAVKIHAQSRSASPKGAVRINAQTNAQILHSLNQLIKINGQILKLQGESFAVVNKEGKDSSHSFNKSNNYLRQSMKTFVPDSRFPKF